VGTVNGSDGGARSLRVELLAALLLDGFSDLTAIDVVYGVGSTVVWLPDCQAGEVVQAMDRVLYRQCALLR
jgi:hypothetical protein